MKTIQQTSSCSAASLTRVPTTGARSLSLVALVHSAGAVDLASLARSIREDRNLYGMVMEAALEEFGLFQLSVEEAIVLLGRQRLCSLLAPPRRITRPARNFRNTVPISSITPSANPCRLEIFQGKLK